MGIYTRLKCTGAILGIFLFFSACGGKKPLTAKKERQNTFYLNLGSSPPTLHPIRASDFNAFLVHKNVMEGLAGRNLQTHQLEPRLARSWTLSPDSLVYTFYLREKAFWHDGRPVTAEDVLFSLEAVQDISYGGGHRRPYFENILKAKVIDSHTIEFTARRRLFGSFENLAGGLVIIPKHIYEGKKTKLNRVLVGSGPYALSSYDRGKKIILKKNKKWWGWREYPGKHNFEKIVYRVIQSRQDKLMRMAQGQLDFIRLSSEEYFKKTNTPPWGQTVLKEKTQNLAPKSYSFLAWNLKRPLFQDKKIRKALSLLMNRALMNEKFNNNTRGLAAGPTYRQNDYADPQVEPILFSPKKALKFLTEAGWRDSDQNGILDRIDSNGVKKEFRFTLIFPLKEVEKYLTIYQQDLKKSGIDMSLKFMEWVSFSKLLDEKNFDVVTLAWAGGAVEWHPRQIWHSSSAQGGGSNFISYSNPKVDHLIDLADEELDRKKRVRILRKVYRMIAEDHPYSFMFYPKYVFYARSKNVQADRPTYKYDIGLEYWRPASF